LKPSKQFVFFAFRKHQIIIGEISILLFKLALLGWLAKLDQSQQWWIGDLGGLGVVDLFEFSGHWFSVFPITEGERITNQMDDAGLDLTVRINRANGFGKAL
jgi:hypothetical protein